MRIGVIGGTGSEGRGLALRWARAGHHVAIGSRNAERARERAAELAALAPQGVVAGGDNAWAVADAEVVLLSVPYDAHEATLHEHQAGLQGRVLIDITVPLKPPRVSEVHLPRGQIGRARGAGDPGGGGKGGRGPPSRERRAPSRARPYDRLRRPRVRERRGRACPRHRADRGSRPPRLRRRNAQERGRARIAHRGAHSPEQAVQVEGVRDPDHGDTVALRRSVAARRPNTTPGILTTAPALRRAAALPAAASR